jgi:hypothetical protein
MVSGKQVKAVRMRLGLRWVDVAQALGVHWRTVARWEAQPLLTRRQELKFQRIVWQGARDRHFQDLCPTCHGAGLVPKMDAPDVLPPVPKLPGAI